MRHGMRCWLGAAVVAACAGVAGSSARAEPLSDANAAFRRGDYAAVLSIIQPIAAQGAPWAEFSLGLMYEKGHGVPMDFAVAAQWYRRAADQGYANAQANLGTLYFDGHGVAQDYDAAIRWRLKAAEQDFTR